MSHRHVKGGLPQWVGYFSSGTLGLAFTVGVFFWQQHQASDAAKAQAMEDLKIRLTKLETRIDYQFGKDSK